MKFLTTFFLLLLLFGLTNITYGQQPYKLVDTSNKWFEHGQYGGWGYYDLQLVRLTYFFKGDTIISGLKYKKLMHDRRDTIYSTQPYIQDSYGYTAAFRQDSLKVYFVLKDSIKENLYCDFEISKGNQLQYYYGKSIVKNIDSIPFGNTFRKKYILENGISFYEGIGLGYGLFHNFNVGIEGGVYLTCFEQNNIIQYVSEWSSNQGECGLYVTSINENSFFNDLKIFPNPFSEQTILQTDFQLKNASLTLENIHGQTIKQIKNISGQTINLQRDNLTSGLYFVRLTQNNNVIIFAKLFVID